MDRSLFHYDLPAELIAQVPLADRTASRLLLLQGSTVSDRQFSDLPNLLRRGDLLVMNDTRVIPARLHGRKRTGGRIEVLLERITGPRTATAQVRASKSPKPGAELELADGVTARVEGRAQRLFDLSFDTDLGPFLAANGEVPLPPYIDRPAGPQDAERYQTVYAREGGAVAAPTAGLHFDVSLLSTLRERGVDSVFLTLHVGIGTFAPVPENRIEDHRLHSEWISVPQNLCEAVELTRERNGRVIAVGTTTVRALESASHDGVLKPFEGETKLFIYPGFQFREADILLTNFHLPESSLLMLVAAFAGRERVLDAYQHAVTHGYRFFSYGDAMLVMP